MARSQGQAVTPLTVVIRPVGLNSSRRAGTLGEVSVELTVIPRTPVFSVPSSLKVRTRPSAPKLRTLIELSTFVPTLQTLTVLSSAGRETRTPFTGIPYPVAVGIVKDLPSTNPLGRGARDADASAALDRFDARQSQVSSEVRADCPEALIRDHFLKGERGHAHQNTR
jgi:hypothetical protein